MKISMFIFNATLLAAAWLQTSCGNETTANHKAALPHNHEQSAGPLSQQEADQLASARGKTATLLTPKEFMAKIEQDTSPLLIVNFWKTDCQPCFQIQQQLQKIQQEEGEDQLSLFTVNLGGANDLEKVNLQLRQQGITAPAFLLKTDRSDWQNAFSENWQGEVPAFFARTADGLQQFYQQEFSENELHALLQPLLL